MKVVGTAGHIDHGKSTLVKALTGIDPDRLDEEKQRGLTIDLGFAWLTLPGGTEVSIVDVPGHERFVKNMLAGAGGVDVALLVVAADEGVMPQTREHLAILDLLGVRHGVVALTKVDLVDDEWLDLVREDVQSALSGTALVGSSIVAVSAATGAGLDVLLSALASVVERTPVAEDRQLPFLPIDRAFHVPGFGSVVTGTLHNGGFAVGDDVEVVLSGRRARVRSIQTHRRQVQRAAVGARVALSLAGVERALLERGDVVALPDTVHPTSRFVAHVQVLRDAPFHLRSGLEASMHAGAAERRATIHFLGRPKLGPGETGWAELRVHEPIAVFRRQRFIIRLPAPARTVAGGLVVDVAYRRRRWTQDLEVTLDALASKDLTTACRAALSLRRTQSVREVVRRVGFGTEAVKKALDAQERAGTVVGLDSVYATCETVSAIGAKARHELHEYHSSFPLQRGMPKEELRSRLRWERAGWQALLRWLVESDIVSEEGPLVRAPEHEGGTRSRSHEVARVLETLGTRPYSPPSGDELIQQAGIHRDLLPALADEGQIVRLAEGLYLLRSAYDDLVHSVVETIKAEGSITVAQVRDRFGTSRKYALALLEYLDAQRITRRVGDARVGGSRAPS